MRKLISTLAIVVFIALCAVTLAQAGSRTADPGAPAPAARSEAREQLTIQRLLRDRLEFTLRLARALSFIELPAPVDEPVGNTNGIIDEPDPAGNKWERDDEEERDNQRRRRSEHESMNPWTESSPSELTFRE